MNQATSVHKSMSRPLSTRKGTHSSILAREHTGHNKHTPHMMKAALSPSQAKVATVRVAIRALLNGRTNV